MAERLQHHITQQREQVWADDLHRDFMQLAPGDERRDAWLAADRVSGALHTVWPSREHGHDACVEACIFRDVRCFCLGLPLPTLVVGRYAGRILPDTRTRRYCDVFGHQLGLATLEGGDQASVWHDPLVQLLLGFGLRAGLVIESEVSTIFAHLLDHDETVRGRRTGLRPDLMVRMRARGRGGGPEVMRRVLMDIKTLYAGGSMWWRGGSRSGAAG